MQRIEQRISALEAQKDADKDPVQFIYLSALGQDDEGIVESSTQAAKGHMRWERMPGESLADFRERLEEDCLNAQTAGSEVRKCYLVLNAYANGALYSLRPNEEYKRWGTYTNEGSETTIRFNSSV